MVKLKEGKPLKNLNFQTLSQDAILRFQKLSKIIHKKLTKNFQITQKKHKFQTV